jgi:hypothetical protein
VIYKHQKNQKKRKIALPISDYSGYSDVKRKEQTMLFSTFIIDARKVEHQKNQKKRKRTPSVTSVYSDVKKNQDVAMTRTSEKPESTETRPLPIIPVIPM